MQRYGNLDGHSGVAEYGLAPDRIRIRFVDGPTVYEYDRMRPGARHVREMKARAKEGRGLATYISQHVGTHYARKYESSPTWRVATALSHRERFGVKVRSLPRTTRARPSGRAWDALLQGLPACKEPVRPARRRAARKSKRHAPRKSRNPHPPTFSRREKED